MQAIIADRELEARHRALWALGDYRAVAEDMVGSLGPILVAASGIRSGDQVLDVAAGTGNAAIAAAAAGADVIASDLCPELVEQGRAIAAQRGIGLQWREANAEALPFGDNDFDAVLSCIGVMFAPHHQQAADELLRVCRAGGTIGLLSWTPDGFIGQMFAVMGRFVPPPPPGASAPPLWGSEQHVHSLIGDHVTDADFERRCLDVVRFGDGAQFRDYFKANYGPTIAAYRAIADEPDRVAALDDALARLGDDALAGTATMEWEYLVLVARKR